MLDSDGNGKIDFEDFFDLFKPDNAWKREVEEDEKIIVYQRVEERVKRGDVEDGDFIWAWSWSLEGVV